MLLFSTPPSEAIPIRQLHQAVLVTNQVVDASSGRLSGMLQSLPSLVWNLEFMKKMEKKNIQEVCVDYHSSRS